MSAWEFESRPSVALKPRFRARMRRPRPLVCSLVCLSLTTPLLEQPNHRSARSPKRSARIRVSTSSDTASRSSLPPAFSPAFAVSAIDRAHDLRADPGSKPAGYWTPVAAPERCLATWSGQGTSNPTMAPCPPPPFAAQAPQELTQGTCGHSCRAPPVFMNPHHRIVQTSPEAGLRRASSGIDLESESAKPSALNNHCIP